MKKRNTGATIVSILLVFLLLLLSAVTIRVFTQPRTDTQGQEKIINELKIELFRVKSELKKVIEPKVVSTPLKVQNGVYVRQSTKNGNWVLTVRYPEYNGTLSPAFKLQYPTSEPWGLMRVQYTDTTATDVPQLGEPAYISQYTLRASKSYNQQNDGYLFQLAVASKSYYKEITSVENNIYNLNNDIYISEDDKFVYLYRYLNDEEDVMLSIDNLIKTFIPLNLK